MPVYKTRLGAEAYGYCVGILLLDFTSPFVPGDVGNATTYDYPVLYKTVEGASVSRVLRGDLGPLGRARGEAQADAPLAVLLVAAPLVAQA